MRAIQRAYTINELRDMLRPKGRSVLLNTPWGIINTTKAQARKMLAGRRGSDGWETLGLTTTWLGSLCDDGDAVEPSDDPNHQAVLIEARGVPIDMRLYLLTIGDDGVGVLGPYVHNDTRDAQARHEHECDDATLYRLNVGKRVSVEPFEVGDLEPEDES